MIEKLNKLLESRIRLGIMAILVSKDTADYLELKETLDQTDGNLASHLSTLEKNDYLRSRKKFIGKKPNTRYEATAKGKKAFESHIDALEKLIRIGK